MQVKMINKSFIRNILLIITIMIIPTICISADTEVTILSKNIINVHHCVALSTDKGIIIINTGFGDRTMEAKQEIEQYFDRKDYFCLLNMNVLPGSVGGNSIFNDVSIIGHDDYEFKMNEILIKRKSLATNRFSKKSEQLKNVDNDSTKLNELKESIKGTEKWLGKLNAIKLVPPTITFNDCMTLHCGNMTVQLIYFGKGPAQNPHILIYIPEEGVLFTGVGYALTFSIPHQIYIGEENNLERRINIISDLQQILNEHDKIITVYEGNKSHKDLEIVGQYYQTLYYGIRDSVIQGDSFEEIKKDFSLENKFSFIYQIKKDKKSIKMHEDNIKLIFDFFKKD